ncbi:MAG: disulfide bond formation protein B [Pseudomarimonas sp.]
MNPLSWPFRLHCLLGAAVCAGLLAYALYVQHVLFIDPCPMCVLQRVAFAGFGLVCLVGAVHGPKLPRGRAAYGVLAGFCGLMGGAVAAQHVRLQHLPADQVPACGPGLNYYIDTFPVVDALAQVLRGSGECAKVDWMFAGLSMPEWTLICFAGLVSAAIYAGFRRR